MSMLNLSAVTSRFTLQGMNSIANTVVQNTPSVTTVSNGFSAASLSSVSLGPVPGPKVDPSLMLPAPLYITDTQLDPTKDSAKQQNLAGRSLSLTNSNPQNLYALIQSLR